MTSSLSQMVGRTLKALVMHFHTPLYIIGAAHHRNRVHIANLGWELADSDGDRDNCLFHKRIDAPTDDFDWSIV
jgi:hypothetical protein